MKPLHPKNRRIVTPEIGTEYWISWDGEKTEKVILISVDKEEPKTVRVHRAIHSEVGQTRGLAIFLDELGDSPEHAIENMITL